MNSLSCLTFKGKYIIIGEQSICEKQCFSSVEDWKKDFLKKEELMECESDDFFSVSSKNSFSQIIYL